MTDREWPNSHKSQVLRKLVRVFHNEENPFSHSFSSKIHTFLIIGSGFSYNLTAILVLINLYSCSTDLRPRPLLSLGRYNTAVKLRGCLRPFSLINFLVSLSMLCKSPNGQCWVHIGFVKYKQGE